MIDNVLPGSDSSASSANSATAVSSSPHCLVKVCLTFLVEFAFQLFRISDDSKVNLAWKPRRGQKSETTFPWADSIKTLRPAVDSLGGLGSLSGLGSLTGLKQMFSSVPCLLQQFAIFMKVDLNGSVILSLGWKAKLSWCILEGLGSNLCQKKTSSTLSLVKGARYGHRIAALLSFLAEVKVVFLKLTPFLPYNPLYEKYLNDI